MDYRDYNLVPNFEQFETQHMSLNKTKNFYTTAFGNEFLEYIKCPQKIKAFYSSAKPDSRHSTAILSIGSFMFTMIEFATSHG